MAKAYLVSDTHFNHANIIKYCNRPFKDVDEMNKTIIDNWNSVINNDDIVYHLGDFGFGTKEELQQIFNKLNGKKYLIMGNHDRRGAKVYYEEDYPNILFAIDGEIYNFNNNKTLVIGGAYSVDKQYRLQMGYKWYESEQPDDKIKQKVLTTLSNNNYKVDVILSHTCPFKYMPYEVFLSGIDQEKVDKSTEIFLDEIETNTNYNKWYCGHYHTDKVIDKIRFMHHDIEEFIESRFTNA